MNLEEKMKELFEGSGVSDDTLIKLRIMIEEAISEKTQPLLASIDELLDLGEKYGEEIRNEMEKLNEEKIEEVKKELEVKAEEYAKYVVEQFIEEHQKQLIEGVEYQKMKDAFDSIKLAFETNGYQINLEESAELKIAELEEAIEAQKVEYSNLFEELYSVKKELDEIKYANIFESLTKDLAETQKEKVEKLLENISFRNIDEFKRGIELIVEELSSKKETEVNNQPVEEDIAPVGKMGVYLKHL